MSSQKRKSSEELQNPAKKGGRSIWRSPPLVYPRYHEAPELSGLGGKVGAMAISGNGNWLVTGDGKKVCLWDLKAKKRVKTFAGHTDTVNSVAVNHTGSVLVSSADTNDRAVRVWDGTNKTRLHTFKKCPNTTSLVSMDNEGKWIVTGKSDGQILVYDQQTGECVQTMKEPDPTGESGKKIVAVAISPDGTWIASAAVCGSLRIWKRESGEEVKTLQPTSSLESAITCMVFTADSKLLISGGRDNKVHVWDHHSGLIVQTHQGWLQGITSVSVTEDTQTVVIHAKGFGGRVRIWNRETEDFQDCENDWGCSNTAVVHPDGSKFFIGTDTGRIKVYRL